MSTILAASDTKSSSAPSSEQRAPNRWIINAWMDLLLFSATPLLIIPLVMALQSRWVGTEVDTISLIVAAFGGLGHHLPGMIRAYSDRALFQRFRYRFIVAPLFLLAVCIPLSEYHLNGMYLVLAVWGCWHALMQVYGFVRIYDVKSGCYSTWTAMWDWLLCLSWFSTAQVFSNGKMARMLEYFYASGGPLIPPSMVEGFRWVCLSVSVVILAGFLVNHLIQTVRGPQPNPAKLLMLATGIGFWWFAMVYVENIILGIALFEIFHDVQYLAIVWLYNCRRVDSTVEIGPFMRFLFRRSKGLMALYLGLVFGYGLMGLASYTVSNDGIKQLFQGVIWASTLLHFYYDGFIWKVREKATRAGLGLIAGNSQFEKPPSQLQGELIHLLKWSPLIAILIWLSTTELGGSAILDEKNMVREWPRGIYLERLKNIAASVPGDLRAQRRAAITIANLDSQQNAIQFLKRTVAQHPDFAEGFQLLGDIHQLGGEFDKALGYYHQALTKSRTKTDKTMAHHRLGEVYRAQGRTTLAKAKFKDALKVDPKFIGSIQALQQLEEIDKKASST